MPEIANGDLETQLGGRAGGLPDVDAEPVAGDVTVRVDCAHPEVCAASSFLSARSSTAAVLTCGAPGIRSAEARHAVSATPRTRLSAAWAGICAAALALVALIVFMLQNTRSVEVTYLWMHGTIPLALALLIAAVGAAILTMVFGAGRITQLRRLARRRRQ